MGIGNLSGDDGHLRTFGGNVLYDFCKIRKDAECHCRSRYVKGTVRRRNSLGVAGLSDRCQDCGDGGADIISQENRNCTGQSDDAGDTVRSCLAGEVLKHRDGSGTALYHQGHHGSQGDAQNRHILYLTHQLDEHIAGCQRLHHAAHDFNSFEQQPKGEDHHADLFDFVFLRDEVHDKTDENNRVDVVAELKRQQLCCHCGTDVGTENHRNRLGHADQPGTDESDNHNGGGGTALEHCRYQCAGQNTHYRILGQESQNPLHLISGRLLKGIAHFIHSVKENCQSSQQTE